MSTTIVDHLVLGTGQATLTLLQNLPATESIAVIEKGKVGGVCVNTGCTPTKTLIASARVAHLARRAAHYGVVTGEVRVDLAAAMQRMNDYRALNNEFLTNWIEAADHMELVKGHGRFVGDRTVDVEGRRFEGRNVYINVGTRTRIPDIAGLRDVALLDHAGLLNIRELPEHLVILGGSYIGLEFGQAFLRFGSKVTVIEASPRLLPREDADVSAALHDILSREGMAIHVGATTTQVERAGKGVVLTVDGAPITGSHLFLAAGRIPNSDDLGLDTTGIETDAHGFIVVDEHASTAVPSVYAVGDVNGRGAFTHTSVHDAQIVLDHLAGGQRRISDRVPTYALFVDPALGRVGLTEQQAVDAGHDVLVATRPMSKINRAVEMGETDGLVKLVVDAKDDRILGATVLGAGGDEIVQIFTAIMAAGQPCHNFRHTMFIHPTIAELLPFILDDLKPSELSRSGAAG